MRIDRLSALTGAGGPFATVVLDVSRDAAAGAHEVEVRWKDHASRLAELGAPAAVVDALAVVTGPTGRRGPLGRLAVATAQGVVLDLLLPEPPVREATLWGPVPHLLPAFRALRGHLALLVVETDAAGAEFDLVSPWGEVTRQQVEGDNDVLHAPRGVGLSSRRLQARVEDSIARNAGEVAQALAQAFRAHRPDLVLVAGEDEAVAQLLARVPAEVAQRAVRLEHGRRAAGADTSVRDREIAAAVAAELHRRESDLIERYVRSEAIQQAAVQSLDDVMTALQRGQVDEVLLVDDPRSDLTLWATGRPEQLARDRDDLAAMGAGDGQQTRADAALVWAVLGTGAGLTLFDDPDLDPLHDTLDDAEQLRPPTLRDGIGATLRWADGSTPHDGAPSMPGHGEGPGEPDL